MKSRIIALMLVLFVILGLNCPRTLADENKEGIYGTNLVWTLEGGVLTISGIGVMEDKCTYEYVWTEGVSVDAIKMIVIEEGITSIGKRVFENCYLASSIIFPSTLTNIEEYAFRNCQSLKSVLMPDNVIIGENAFRNCIYLNDVVIGDNSVIGETAFMGCENLKSLTIGSNVNLGALAFASCRRLLSITIGDGITMDYGVFEDCITLKDVILPNSMTTIACRTFSGCDALTNVKVPENVITIEKSAFSGCDSLINVEMSNNVLVIDDAAFSGCEKLDRIRIPEGVESIGNNAFSRCKNLTSVILPSSLKTIGEKAFYLCDNLLDIYYSGTEEEWDKISIEKPVYLFSKDTINYNNISQPDIYVYLNEEKIVFDVAPTVMKERTLVPLRGMCEAIGATVEWKQDTKEILVKGSGVDALFKVGEKFVCVNGSKMEIDVEPSIISSRTMIPLRALSEILGAQVLWSGYNRIIIINY